MGSLNLPISGTVYVDAQIAIYTVERFPKYASPIRTLWTAAQAGTITVVSSDLTLMETLVLPLRNSDLALASDFETLWKQSNSLLVPVTQVVLRKAAQLRTAIPALSTPDAIHAATAMLHGSTLFITNDVGFRRIPGLGCTILDDVVAA